MVRRIMQCGAVAILISSLGILAGCGSSQSSVGITPSAALLLPGQSLQFASTWTGAPGSDVIWQVNGKKGGSASTGTISPTGIYTAPPIPPSQPIQVGIQNDSAVATVTIFNSSQFTAGAITDTQNPLVAQYTISVPNGSLVQVQFGPDTGYGFSTSAVPTPIGGGPVAVLVAGMRASSTYHMQGMITLANGSHILDTDQTFTTGAIPADQLPNMTVQFGTGTPSPGVELFSLDPENGGNPLAAVATDLAGNVIWYYDLPEGIAPFPIKPLSNGHMLLIAAAITATGGVNPQDVNEIREIDLAGNVVNRITINQLNQALSGVATFRAGFFHHDILPLANGHLILLVGYTKTLTNTPGVPPGTVVTGDALIDWDPQQGPVWTWSTFDHFDPARAPFGIVNGAEDWTHSNALIYSPDDGNLILSMRNQNWVIKINYNNGTGDGSVLWKLGGDGDFVLPGQEAPIEWNYGQHYVTVVSPNSSGVFSLMFFNNGNNRMMNSSGSICGSTGVGPCYSSVPIFQLDESAKTASVQWEYNLLPAYSVCCGDALVLPNGNVEFDIAYDIGTPNISHIEEVTKTQSPELVWKMDIAGQLAYRGYRIPSLYPGQVWPAAGPSNVQTKKQPKESHQTPKPWAPL